MELASSAGVTSANGLWQRVKLTTAQAAGSKALTAWTFLSGRPETGSSRSLCSTPPGCPCRARSESFHPCFKDWRDFFSGLDEKANLRGNLAAEVNLVNS